MPVKTGLLGVPDVPYPTTTANSLFDGILVLLTVDGRQMYGVEGGTVANLSRAKSAYNSLLRRKSPHNHNSLQKLRSEKINVKLKVKLCEAGMT
ncbi:unnamed protein product, partial [Didymodactylos carnosus]